MNEAIRNHRRIREHNMANSPLRFANRTNAADFFTHSEGSLLITGGRSENMVRAVLSAVRSERIRSGASIIILSDSTELRGGFINMVGNEALGRAVVCSEQFKNLDVFAGMNRTAITAAISDTASRIGFQNVNDIQSYSAAFLTILESMLENGQTLSLSTINTFAHNTDTDIVRAAGNDMAYEREVITGSKGGVDFRTVVDRIASAFSGVSVTDKTTGFSIVRAATCGYMTFIDTNTADAKTMGCCIAHELAGLGNITIIVHDSRLTESEDFMECMNSMKTRGGCTICLSVYNAAALKGSDSMLNFNRNIVFLNGGIAAGDMQRILDIFGQYDHMEESVSENRTSGFFSVFERPTRTNGAQLHRRSVVTLAEVKDCDAVISGNCGSMIIAVKNFSV